MVAGVGSFVPSNSLGVLIPLTRYLANTTGAAAGDETFLCKVVILLRHDVKILQIRINVAIIKLNVIDPAFSIMPALLGHGVSLDRSCEPGEVAVLQQIINPGGKNPITFLMLRLYVDGFFGENTGLIKFIILIVLGEGYGESSWSARGAHRGCRISLFERILHSIPDVSASQLLSNCLAESMEFLQSALLDEDVDLARLLPLHLRHGILPDFDFLTKFVACV